MNTSVSPLPIPVWPLLGLSLALVSVTATVVTLTSQRATQQFRAQAQPALDIEAPVPGFAVRASASQRRAVMVAAATS